MQVYIWTNSDEAEIIRALTLITLNHVSTFKFTQLNLFVLHSPWKSKFPRVTFVSISSGSPREDRYLDLPIIPTPPPRKLSARRVNRVDHQLERPAMAIKWNFPRIPVENFAGLSVDIGGAASI